MALDPTTNAVAPSTFRQIQAQSTLPSSAADDSGREPVQSSPVNGQLQPPTQSPTQQPMQLQPAQPATPAQPPTSNPKLFGFIGSVLHGTLRALAGPQATTYTTDSSGRVIKDPNQPVDTIGAQGRRLAAHALEGLAAGAAVQQPRYGSKASALASGLGAGAAAQAAAARAADDKARGQAKEDYEAQQRTILQKHNVALGNAAMASHYFEMRKQGIEMLQPTYDAHKALGAALTDAGVQIPTMFAEEADKLRQADPHFLADNIVLPVGQAPVTDDKGNQIFGPNENGDQVVPLMHEQVMVIPAAHKDDATGTTKFQIPPALADEIHQFAPIAGGSGYDGIKAGDEYSLDQLSPVLTQMQLGRKAAAAGWQEKTPGENAALDKDGNVIQRNPASGETRPYKGGAPLQAQERLGNIGKKGEDTKEAKLRQDLTGAQIDETKARTKKLNKENEQENLFNPPGSEGLTGEEYLRTLPTDTQNLLKALNEGRDSRSTRQLQDKEGNPSPLARALHRTYSDFDITKVENFAKVRKDFSSPNGTGGQITAFGTVLNHMRRLYDNATTAALVPGTEAHRKLEVDTHNVAVEMANALTTHGKAAEAEIKSQEESLNAWTPAGRRQKVQEAVRLLDGKLSEREQQWKNAAPSRTYAPPMPSVSPEAMLNAEYVLNGGKTQSAQNPQSGQAQSAPAGATGKAPGSDGKMHYHDAQGRDLGVAQ
jgi:hypothetical protein